MIATIFLNNNANIYREKYVFNRETNYIIIEKVLEPRKCYSNELFYFNSVTCDICFSNAIYSIINMFDERNNFPR